MPRLYRDEDLYHQGVERRGMCLVTTTPQPEERQTTGRLVTYHTASRAVPTQWERIAPVLQEIAGWIGLFLILGVFVGWWVL